MHRVHCCLLSSMLAGAVAGQATLVVGLGGYPQISAAIAAAQPGDIVNVLPGTYDPFTVSIPLTIVAPGAAVVRPPGIGSSSFSSTSFDLQPGETVVVAGLQFESHSALHGHSVGAHLGQVVFQGCQFLGGHPYSVDQGLSCTDADVVLLNCSFATHELCLRIDGGSLVAHSTSFVPTFLAPAFHPVTAILAVDASVQASLCTLQGANGLVNTPAYPGAIFSGSSKAYLAQCTVSGGNANAYPGPPGIRNLTTLPIKHWQCAVSGGQGFSVGLPANGAPFEGPQLATTLITTTSSAATPFSMTNRSEPGRLIAVGISFDLVPPTTVPFATPHVRFDPAFVASWSLGITDPGGYYTSPPTAPATPAMFGRTAWLHPLLLDGGGLLAGTPAGLIVR